MAAASRDTIVFLLNGERHEVPRSVPPTRTLLDYLREDLRLKGTKEGCNEGDCGACTVVVRGPEGEAKAVNACILLVPMLDGKSMTTVEALHGPEGELHPCQQAMVECHGSQCGFCTPGFVMSLYAYYRTWQGEDPKHRSSIDDALAGNLCRCTGYGPIAAAARRMFDLPLPAWQSGRNKAEVDWLGTVARDASLALDAPEGRYFSPRTLVELGDNLGQHPTAQILGGGTDIGLWVTKRLAKLPVLISTGNVEELKRLEVVKDAQDVSASVWIGSAVTYDDAALLLAMYYPDLGELIRRLGSAQVRNSGTIGGNIANGSPIGDMPPALIALGATLILNGPQGQRRMPLEDYFVAYGKQDRKAAEFVEAVDVPVHPSPRRMSRKSEESRRLRCYKITKRFDQDISAVLGCFYLTIEAGTVASARIAFGGMAPTPKRAKAVEAALIGQPWTMAAVEASFPAFELDFQPISDMRASAAYRMTVAKNLLVRYFHETTSDVPTRLVGADATIAGLA